MNSLKLVRFDKSFIIVFEGTDGAMKLKIMFLRIHSYHMNSNRCKKGVPETSHKSETFQGLKNKIPEKLYIKP